MAKRKRLLARSTRTVIEDFREHILDPVASMEEGYKQLKTQYDEVGKDKSSLKADAKFNTEDARYMEILKFVDDNGGDASEYKESHQEMIDKIEADSKKGIKDLGDLVEDVEEEEITIPPLKTLKRTYPQVATITGCLEVLQSLSRSVTPENQKNNYGIFLGVCGIYDHLLFKSERENVDVTDERLAGLEIYRYAKKAFQSELTIEEQVRNNGLCSLKSDERKSIFD